MSYIECCKYTDYLYNFKEIGKQNPESPKFGYVDAWLYLGSERAALIDTLDQAKGLYEEVHKITSLPIDVWITHGHEDHAGVSLQEFAEHGCTIYMNKKDLSILPSYDREEWFTDLKDGEIISLGDRKLKAVSCAGHTMGSMVFVDRENDLMFSGDTIGSCRIWLQLPHSTSLREFRKNLIHLLESTGIIENLKIYPGHVWQTLQMPLMRKNLEDLLQGIEMVLDGTAQTKKKILELGEIRVSYEIAAYGSMEELCFDPKHLYEGTTRRLHF